MKNNQTGFVIPLLIVIVLLISGGGIYVYAKKESIKIPKKDTSVVFDTVSTSTAETGAGRDKDKPASHITSGEKPKLPSTSTPPTNYTYSKDSISECAECGQNGNPSNLTCCTTTFGKECATRGGVVRWRDGHPGPYSSFKTCLQKAPDAGKACGTAKDCLSSVCNLEIATSSGKCSLITKILTGGHNNFGDQEFFTATYSCNTSKPGVCMEAADNVTNPGGLSHTFNMDGQKLIEILESGPIF